MAMLYTRGPADMAAFAASQPLTAWPGTRWSYSSGDTNILMAVLKGAIGEGYADYPWKRVFDPLGMDHVTWERDGSGTFVGSSYLYATALDQARWGQMVLDDGAWNGERLLAPGWVRYTTTMAPSFYTTPVGHDHYEDNPGAQWYVNRGDPDRGLDKPWKYMPDDAFGASGHWGKGMWVIPSWDVVVVRVGDDREYGCELPTETDCVADREAAFTASRFHELLAAAVAP
jgi:CubicO group peptidase (beta-lactamase class C family)